MGVDAYGSLTNSVPGTGAVVAGRPVVVEDFVVPPVYV
jgi:hypothetical protein